MLPHQSSTLFSLCSRVRCGVLGKCFSTENISFSELNAPRSSYHSIRPLEIIEALVNHSPGKHNSLFSSREHQDAQELFQLVSECIKKEITTVNRERQRDRGLGGLSQFEGEAGKDIGLTVFDGLTANRRSCMECGYTEAVMHFAFDSWQLAIPRYVVSCFSGETRCCAHHGAGKLPTRRLSRGIYQA